MAWKPEYNDRRDPADVARHSQTYYARRKQREPDFLKNRAAVQRLRYSNGYALQTKYKRSLADYSRVLAEQDGGCAVCGKKPTSRLFHWDHDHRCCLGRNTCGRCVRGIVCPRCNMFISFIETGPVAGLLAYLVKWGGARIESIAAFGSSFER